jgi:thioredoxin reductase
LIVNRDVQNFSRRLAEFAPAGRPDGARSAQIRSRIPRPPLRCEAKVAAAHINISIFIEINLGSGAIFRYRLKYANQAARAGAKAMDAMNGLPIAVIGGGPVGLAAAAHLIARGLPVRLYEAGDTIGANVLAWAHVRLFSPWRFNIDAAARSLLRERGWQAPPPDALPTGRELHDAYLAPLADALAAKGAIATNACVRSIARRSIHKVVSGERARHPFALAVAGAAGERIEFARAVIDASGTWQNPNPLGASGLSAAGETQAADCIDYGIPDVLGGARARHAGAHTLVVGGGHSAANVLLDLARLADADPRTRITWAVRGRDLVRVFGGRVDDRLPARAKLGSDLKALVEAGRIQLVTGFSAEGVARWSDGVAVTGQVDGETVTLGPVDRIVVATGQRPDLSLTRELRLDLDPWLESPRTLGPAIDPNLHSCGTVPPHGYRQLTHPEPDYFAVGVKSYGRAPTFLMATGYEQVRSVAAHLAGDKTAADDVRRVLPETGVRVSDI